MSEMVGNTSPYTDVQRKEAAIQYAIKGNLSSISRAIDIPRKTLSDWKQTDWWDEIVAEVRHAKSDEHIARYVQLVDEGQRIALEKLPEASARDAMIIAATATDKARLLLNQPTSISSNSASMSELQAQFEALAANHKAIQSTVIAVQDDAETA